MVKDTSIIGSSPWVQETDRNTDIWCGIGFQA